MPFNIEKMRRKHRQHVEKAGNELMQKYAEEIDDLNGFDGELLGEYGGTTAQLDSILEELEKAKNQNLAQAKFKENLMKLGQSTYELAKKVSDLIP